MKMKAEVNLEGVSWRMFGAAIVVESVYALFGAEAIITSAKDGKHMDGSLHYEGLALDFRTRNVRGHELTVAAKVRAILKPLGYDVVLEKDHLHVEYDPK